MPTVLILKKIFAMKIVIKTAIGPVNTRLTILSFEGTSLFETLP